MVNVRPLPSTGAVTGVVEALSFLRDADFAQRRFERYGNVYQTRLLGQSMVFVRGGAAINDLLAQPDATEGWWPESVRQLLGSRSLANRNGADHKARRRVVGQLFSAAALRRYSPAIVGLVDDLAADLQRSTGPIALADRMRRFAFAVIATVVLGLDGEARDALFADFEIWTRALFSVPLAIPGSPFARALAARARLLHRLQQVLEQARQSATAGLPLSGGLDLLSGGLDEAGLPLSDDDLVEQLLLLLFAGYETTASSLSCLMLAVLQEQDLVPWLDEELNGLSWPPIAEQATPRLNAVVLEVMRLNPPVGGFFRRTTRPVVLEGVEVPAGCVVQVALAASNRYRSTAATADGGDGAGDDLDRFWPQRHLAANNGLTLLPFGGGERVCLGKALAELEIRLMAVGLLQQVRFSLVPEQDLTLQLIPSPSPRSGLLVMAQASQPSSRMEPAGGPV
jgi:cytochrome P450